MIWGTERSKLFKLHRAVGTAKLSLVRSLIEIDGVSPHFSIQNEKLGYHGNALHAFAASPHGSYGETDRRILDYLLHCGLDINAPCQTGETPLHLAIRSCKQENANASDDLIVNLLEAGADARCKTPHGNTALHYLTATPSIDDSWKELLLKRILKSAKFDIDVDNQSGHTALMLAASRGSKKMYDILCDLGRADLLKETPDGKTAVHFAASNGHHVLARYIRDKEENARAMRGRALPAPAVLEVIAPKEDVQREEWVVLNPSSISRVQRQRAIGYKLTEIFNFSTRMYTCLGRNLETNAEAMAVKTFDEFEDKTPLREAFAELKSRGGMADEAAIVGRTLPKTIKPAQS